MAKHGRGEGTIYKHKDKGLWVGQISLDNGKRKTFYGKTRADVAQRMTAAKADLSKGLPLPNERQTVGQYLESWLEMIKSELKPSSYRRYQNLSKYMKEALGKTALPKLSAQQVKVFYSRQVHIIDGPI